MSQGDEAHAKILYPYGLLSWAGHRSGGVRKPFRDESGRPAGQIDTPLTDRLEEWSKQIVADKDGNTPRSILLVGGPGNGKTDAIERCIKMLDSELHASGNLVELFAQKFDIGENQLIPRRIEADLGQLNCDLPKHLNCKIILVQDASETSSATSAEELFLQDITGIQNAANNDIYLCCINRGILANASNIADEKQSDVVEAITKSVTSTSQFHSCWPLENFESIAVWPMDIESLVDRKNCVDGQTVAHKIFEAALDETKWSATCDLGDACPFCQNKKLLLEKNNIDGVISILRFYELTSGKRWTFRDLFSLVPYLLVGDVAELKIKNKEYLPCDWAKEQSKDKSRAPYVLASRLFHHRLFPIWPTLDRGKYRDAKKLLKNSKFAPNTPGITEAADLFKFLARNNVNILNAGGEVPKRIRESFCESLDPANVDGGQVLFTRKNTDVTAKEVEDKFSLSVKDGYKHIERRLTLLEKNVLKKLISADDALIEDNFPRPEWAKVGLLQRAIRQFAARFAKRSLCVRMGITTDKNTLDSYEELIHSGNAIKTPIKQLSRLLREKDNSFRAGLATTFGQPLATRERDVSLIMKENIKVKQAGPGEIKTQSRPAAPIRFLKVNEFDIPLTFQLYKALMSLGNGMHQASLGTDIFSLLDRVKAMVAGRLVRDQSILDDEPFIQVGLNQKIVIETDGFTFESVDFE
ncbi:MAG TPA: hypothetical protein DCY03_32390 [Planctomycetaceae bacterium]|nr:hypothetical protein [Planctomycetaceae bacterium]|tara:strand:+ start:2915 stop:5008 length:2094 start_codon:yes stop_codon:yes gene_type:complete